MKCLPLPASCLTILSRYLLAGALAFVPATSLAQQTRSSPWESASIAPAFTYTQMQRAAPARPVPPPLSITAEQLDAMVDLFSAPPEEIMQRLWLDPRTGAPRFRSSTKRQDA
jgi:hypothetical protein